MSAGAAGPARGGSLWWLASGAIILLVAAGLAALLVALSAGGEVRVAPAPTVVRVVPAPVAVSTPPASAAAASASVPTRGGGFVPVYAEAARTFGVNWLLLASVHAQETAFSTERSTYRGLNFAGCCAGPMQFNVTNGPVSTWSLYRTAYSYGRRPAAYPHPTARHPSVYDDFDAVMAAGWLLRSAGAGPRLDARAWRAAYDYYGHDAFGTVYASQVLARANQWSRGGFCPACAPPQWLVDRYDAAYGAPARAALRPVGHPPGRVGA